MRGRRLRFWHLPLGLMCLFVVMEAAAVSRRFSWSAATDCVILDLINSPHLHTMIDMQTGMSLSYRSQETVYHATFSPDGKNAGYVRAVTPTGSALVLYSMMIENVSTGSTVEIPGLDLMLHDLAWSPDSRQLAFDATLRLSDEIVSQHRLVIANADGTHVRLVPISDDLMNNLSWSPDSTYLVAPIRGGFTLVRAADLAVSHSFFDTRRYQGPLGTMYGWLPGGHQLAYIWQGSDHENLGVFDPDTDVTQSTSAPPNVSYSTLPDWSPDNRYGVTATFHTSGPTTIAQLTLFDHSKSLDGIVLGNTANDRSYGGWSANSHTYLFIQADQQALIAYDPQTEQQQILMPDGVQWMSRSPDGSVFLVMREHDGLRSLNIVYPGEKRTVVIDDQGDSYAVVDWLTDQNTLLASVGSKRGFALERINLATLDPTILIDNLASKPVLVPQNSTGEIALWLSNRGLGVYHPDEQTLSIYPAQVHDPLAPFGLVQFSPDGRRAFLDLNDNQGISLQLVSVESPSPVVLYAKQGLTTFSVKVVHWSPDSSRLLFEVLQRPLQIVGNDGTPVMEFASPKQFSDARWSTCDPYQVR